MNEQDKELLKRIDNLRDNYEGVICKKDLSDIREAQKAQTQDDERKRAAESTVEMINKLFNIMAEIIDPEKLEGFRKLQNRKVEECKQKILNPESNED